MNAHFIRARRFIGRKIDIFREINVLRIIRLRFFSPNLRPQQTVSLDLRFMKIRKRRTRSRIPSPDCPVFRF
jgi:hypothetical protein